MTSTQEDNFVNLSEMWNNPSKKESVIVIEHNDIKFSYI